jgi:hypothetical protein
MALPAKRLGLGLLLIGAFLAFPLWYPLIMRRVDTQLSRRELVHESERRARAGGQLIRRPTGETVRAVVYTPGDTADAQIMRYGTWVFRLFALMQIIQLVAGAYHSPERRATIED